MKPLSECRLYAFVDFAYLHGREPEAVARQLCDGGADLIQLRAKQLPVEELRPIAEDLRDITRSAGVALVINDHLSLAVEVDSDFCHLGQEDFFETGRTDVSQIRPPSSRLKLGLSTHSPEQAQRAIDAGADYIAIGPVYATSTKPSAKPVTLDYVRWAAANVKVPWFAIGGINLKTLDAVLDAGARRVCVVSAILNANEVSAACRQFKARIVAADQTGASTSRLT
jgi:thiamine-phosphate pyrophosphorylase